MDTFGHVNHTRYVEFLEEARWGYFDQIGPVVERLHERGILHAVVRLDLNYRRGAGVGDGLRIETSIKEVGRTSVVMEQRVLLVGAEELVADAIITNVFLDQRTGRPVLIRDEMLPLCSSSPTPLPSLAPPAGSSS